MDIENKNQKSGIKTAIFYITENGLKLAERLKGLYLDVLILKFKSNVIPEIWNECRNLIFIMATGIVVRTIAPLIKDKKTDPAVVVLDEKGKYAISLLSGHLGGANDAAREIADFLGGEAVITTASDAKLYLRPKNLVIGIGCNSGASEIEIEDAVRKTLEEHNLFFPSIHSITTIDIKANESGLIAFAQKYNLGVNAFSPDELNTVPGIQKSEAARKATGAKAVAEPAAILASGADMLIVPKQKIGNVTVAVAELSGEQRVKEQRQGRIYIVGTGPGSIEHITPYAQKVIKRSDVIVGYGTYLALIQELVKDKEVVSTGMTQEVDRCAKAVELALSGKTVSVISGGDPGIYAMAGLVFEVLRDQRVNKSATPSNPRTLESLNPSVEVIPGISALNACAARLGAPLMHDFACISLSDRLTSWDLIEKRLEAAAMADFVIVLYNPKSKARPDHINKARDILLKYRLPETPVGIVNAAMRNNEKIGITNLRNILDYNIDMQTTAIVGNSLTFIWNNWIITPRGYEKKLSKGALRWRSRE